MAVCFSTADAKLISKCKVCILWLIIYIIFGPAVIKTSEHDAASNKNTPMMNYNKSYSATNKSGNQPGVCALSTAISKQSGMASLPPSGALIGQNASPTSHHSSVFDQPTNFYSSGQHISPSFSQKHPILSGTRSFSSPVIRQNGLVSPRAGNALLRIVALRSINH